MSTNSTIAIQNLDGTIHQIYCHWDGYVEHNGRILKEYYNTPAKVKQLVSFGGLSSLGIRCEPTKGTEHTFAFPEKDTCVYYGRDRGEKHTKVKIWDNFDFYRYRYQREEYNYLFVEEECKWYLIGSDGCISEFLEELDNIAIEKEEIMIHAAVAYAKTKEVETDLNKIKQTEITKALQEIQVLINDAIKNGKYTISFNKVDGLSDQTFNKIAGILVTTLKEYGYVANCIASRSPDMAAYASSGIRFYTNNAVITISWENA
jgi:hypothetical protein